jgi:hypothetical protein
MNCGALPGREKTARSTAAEVLALRETLTGTTVAHLIAAYRVASCRQCGSILGEE